MQKIELIRQRPFGERLNELTAYITTGFGPVLKHSWLPLLCVAFVVSFLLDSTSQQEGLLSFFRYLLTFVLMFAVETVFVFFVRKVCVDGQDYAGLFAVLRESWGSVCKLLLALLPLLLIVALAYNVLAQPESESFDFWQFMAFLSHLIAFHLLCMYVLVVPNVVVFEGKSGIDALLRSVSLTFSQFFSSLIFYFVLVVIGLILPFLLSAIFELISELASVAGTEFGDTGNPATQHVWYHFLLQMPATFAYLLYWLLCGLSSVLTYGSAVEHCDNVVFLTKFNNFDNL